MNPTAAFFSDLTSKARQAEADLAFLQSSEVSHNCGHKSILDDVHDGTNEAVEKLRWMQNLLSPSLETLLASMTAAYEYNEAHMARVENKLAHYGYTPANSSHQAAPKSDHQANSSEFPSTPAPTTRADPGYAGMEVDNSTPPRQYDLNQSMSILYTPHKSSPKTPKMEDFGGISDTTQELLDKLRSSNLEGAPQRSRSMSEGCIRSTSLTNIKRLRSPKSPEFSDTVAQMKADAASSKLVPNPRSPRPPYARLRTGSPLPFNFTCQTQNIPLTAASKAALAAASLKVPDNNKENQLPAYGTPAPSPTPFRSGLGSARRGVTMPSNLPIGTPRPAESLSSTPRPRRDLYDPSTPTPQRIRSVSVSTKTFDGPRFRMAEITPEEFENSSALSGWVKSLVNNDVRLVNQNVEAMNKIFTGHGDMDDSCEYVHCPKNRVREMLQMPDKEFLSILLVLKALGRVGEKKINNVPVLYPTESC
eukprot:NODE_1452_length_1730_cov_110.959552_g1377_i0.p1 GENE.NODE_1452_length_1730_cov_110.959552_g1377_i0~~NODE_1452_length_1730_cov_110.959552_g1377_i0.p1  ORF type:complete len:477 (+),score=96.45 NODE_1452_length_1730_cov_110.959552_g1377_i0:57-1487(+)